MSDNLKVFDRVYVNVAGLKVKDENGNVLTFTKKEYPTYTVTLTSSGESGYGYVKYNNISYYTSGQAFSVNENDVIKVYVAYGAQNVISLNGEIVSQGVQVEYSHTVTNDVEIRFSLSRGQSNVYITEISDIATLTITENGTYTASGTTRGYSPITVNVPTGETINNQDKSVTPSESSQIVSADSGYTGLGTVTVGAISSSYIGSGITQRTSTDLTASGATVTVPSGYYANQATKSVASGTEGTPTASKGTVSNHSISVTPTVTNVSGYIDGGTKTGTAVSVSASELVSGTYNVTSSGTKDVTNYASISVGSGAEGTPTATKGTVSNHSVSITPSVTNSGGYITGSTKTGTAVTVSASELVSGSQTITENGTVNVTNLASVNVAIPVVTYYTGTSGPVASQYNDGDIYLKVVSN